jgi:phosphonoacetate hydrolase
VGRSTRWARIGAGALDHQGSPVPGVTDGAWRPAWPAPRRWRALAGSADYTYYYGSDYIIAGATGSNFPGSTVKAAQFYAEKPRRFHRGPPIMPMPLIRRIAGRLPMPNQRVEVNGREYRWPTRPTVAITIDGCAPEYLDDALTRGLTPRLANLLTRGGAYHRGTAHMPTFTNPNNLSIVTGAPPVVHGLPGNHYRDPSGAEVQLVEPRFLRAPSVLAGFHDVGARVLAITAKEKLRRLLAAGDVPAVSAEQAHTLTLPAYEIADLVGLVGRPNPGPYEWDLSHYALELGLAVSRARGPLDLLYLSTTDFVQHKEGPGGAMADRFFYHLDALLGEYLDLGYLVGITADHGMHAKQHPDGSPRVHYLEEVLAAAGVREAQVVLPITDPYVRHHGALGSFAWVHLPADERERARDALAALNGVEEVLTREEAAVIYQHPDDRIGDLSVAADGRTALGKSRAHHDLSLVSEGLRSHGGRHEQIVPVIVSRPLSPRYAAWHQHGVQNSDLFDLLLNGD